jgi:hypothetical protein
MFANADAVHTGGDGLEFAADFDGRVRLGIERLDMAGAAIEPDKNAGEIAFRARGIGQGLESKQVGETEAEAGEGAEVEKVPARQAITSRAEVNAG